MLGLPGLSVETDLEETLGSTFGSEGPGVGSGKSHWQSPSGKRSGMSLGGLAKSTAAGASGLPKPPSPNAAARGKAMPSRPVSAAPERSDRNNLLGASTGPQSFARPDGA